MKTYMALNGLRWSRDSGSANCDMPRSAVFGRSGGGEKTKSRLMPALNIDKLMIILSELHSLECGDGSFFVSFLDKLAYCHAAIEQ